MCTESEVLDVYGGQATYWVAEPDMCAGVRICTVYVWGYDLCTSLAPLGYINHATPA